MIIIKMDLEKEESGSTHSTDSQDAHVMSSSQQVVLIVGHNIWEWAFLVICIPNVAAIMISSIVTINHCISELTLENSNFMLELVICIISGVSIIFVLYGIFAEHQYDIYLHSSLVLMALVYSWISFVLLHNCYSMIKLVCNSVATVMWIVGCALSRHATHVPDWSEFRIIGVSAALAALYKQLCFFLVILKFDSVFVVTFAIYSAQIANNFTQSESLLYQGLLFLYAAISWICGKLAVHKEDKYLAFGFSFLNGVYPALIFFQWYKLSNLFDEEMDKQILCFTCIAFGLFAVISKVYLLVNMWKTCKTFDYGLNTKSFQDLVSRDSSSLLAHSRSALVF